MLRALIRGPCAALLGLAFLGGAPAVLAQARAPIVISSGDTTREVVNARLLGRMLERSGFRVEYAMPSRAELPEALAGGNVHMVPELTPEQVDAAFRAPIDDGRVLDLGSRQAGPSDPEFRKLVWSGTRKRWTGAFKLFKNMTMPERDTVSMVRAVEGDGRDVHEVVEEWLARNRKRWKKWVSTSKNWMKP